MSTLISLIRELKVNYLVVDEPFSLKFNNLKGLYLSPATFFGSAVVFIDNHDTKTSSNVIIYNVTNIAYGTLQTLDFEPEWQKMENWQPLTYYSSGNVTNENGVIRFDVQVADTQWPSGAATFTFVKSADISQYSSFEFSIMTPKSSQIIAELHSEMAGANYFSYVSKNTENNNWSKVVFDLNDIYRKVGTPGMQNITQLSIILSGQTIGESVSFWIKDISFNEQVYS